MKHFKLLTFSIFCQFLMDRNGSVIADIKIHFNTTSPPAVDDIGGVIQTAKESGNLTVDIMSFTFPGM